jgi:hypothetical protein
MVAAEAIWKKADFLSPLGYIVPTNKHKKVSMNLSIDKSVEMENVIPDEQARQPDHPGHGDQGDHDAHRARGQDGGTAGGPWRR